MLSKRQLQKRGGSKSQILTTGGINEYNIDPADFNKLVALLSRASGRNLSSTLKSLLTRRELADITRRILIAGLIVEGKTYDEIQKKLHTAKSTVSFVKHSLRSNQGIVKNLIIKLYGLSPAEKYLKRRIKKGK